MKSPSVSRQELRNQLLAGIETGDLELSDALKLARKVVLKSQVEYAKLVGVSKKIIADIELDKGNPTLVTLNKLFAPVGLTVGLKSRKPSKI